MPHKLIYLDTMMWNKLKDQGVDPSRLMDRLAAKGAGLALSEHSIYEIARTFKGNPHRGRDLFQYLKAYLERGIVCVYDNLKQLHGEVAVMNRYEDGVVAFYSPDDYAQLNAEVDKLANGVFDETAESAVSERRAFAESTRSDQKQHVENTPDVRARLRDVAESDLPTWLDSEVNADIGTAMLARHMLRPFEGKLPEELALRNAYALLRIPESRMSKALVRADLYYNWRCANRGSNPKDLIDDMYHVLNATYCEVYATAESGQTEYARLLLTDKTKIAIYEDGQESLEEWLVALLSVAA
jgi:hypothetical protein